MNHAIEKIKEIVFNCLNNIYFKVQISCLNLEGKILRHLKDALSYIVRDIYNKNIIGENPGVDKIINSVSNILLFISEDISSFTENEKNEIAQIIIDIKTNENVCEIISLRLQLQALECHRNSKCIYYDTNKKNENLNKFNEIITILKELDAPLIFDPNYPKYGKLKRYSAKLFKQYQKKVVIKNTNKDISLLKTIYNSIGKVISIILLILVICSSLYEFGYSYKIGISLNKIPIDYFDIIFSSFEWFPLILLGILIFFIKEFYSLRFTSSMPVLHKREEQLYYLYYSIFVASIVLSHSSFKSILIWYFILFIASIVWVRLISWVYFHPKVAINTPLYIKYILSYVLPLLLIFFLNGYLRASEDIISTKNITTVELTNDQMLYKVRILRNFRSGILFTSNKKLYFIPNAQLRKIYFKQIK